MPKDTWAVKLTRIWGSSLVQSPALPLLAAEAAEAAPLAALEAAAAAEPAPAEEAAAAACKRGVQQNIAVGV